MMATIRVYVFFVEQVLGKSESSLI